MAITAQESDFFTPPRRTSESHGRVRIAHVTHTQKGEGAAGSTIDLWRVPPGRVRILSYLSRVRTSAFGAGRQLDVGHTGYAGPNANQTLPDAGALHDGKAVGSAGAFAPDATDTLLIDSTAGTTLRATLVGGTIPDGASIEATFLYVAD